MSMTFDEIASLKVGDVLFECQYGANISARVVIEPVAGTGYEGRRTLAWKAENTEDGTPIDYGLTEGLEHYGPRIYSEPQYAVFRDGKATFPLVGAKP